MRSPIDGAHYSYSFAQNDRLRVELYIDSGDADENLEIFERFRNQQAEIEQAYGGELSWEELPARRACRIAAYKEDGCTVLDKDRHDEFIDWLLSASTPLRAALNVPALPAG
jgi:hypothetical protein